MAGTATRAASIGSTIARTARRLRGARLAFGHGTHDALQEATWLVAHVLQAPFEAMSTRAGQTIPTRSLDRIDRLTDRRINERIPLAYIVREAWLGSVRFYIDERAIVPRSFIAELLPDRLQPWIRRPGQVRRVLDLCTGSGCLAILAAKAFSRAAVDAIDLSKSALQVARRNVRMHGLHERVRVLESDLFGAIRNDCYDVILSNPPYVNKASMNRLPEEYRHEPEMALAGGIDGLDCTARILDEARDHLTPNGRLIVEIGHNRKALERRFPRLPFHWITTSGGDDFVFALDREALH